MRTSQIPHPTGAVSLVFEDEKLRIFFDYAVEPYIVVTEKLPESRCVVLEARWAEHLSDPEILTASTAIGSNWVSHLEVLYNQALRLPEREEETQAFQTDIEC